MPRQRFFNLAPEARERLLAIATAHFARRGFEAASLNEILAEAGISKGAYYYYFDDKDDLFATVLERSLDAMLARRPEALLDRVSRAQFWPAVERFVKAWAAALEPSSDVFQAALQLSEEQRRTARFAPILAKAQAMTRELIEAGRRLGCIRTDLPVELLVRLFEANDAVLDSIFIARNPTMTPAGLEAHVTLVVDTLKRLLRSEQRPGRPRRPRG